MRFGIGVLGGFVAYAASLVSCTAKLETTCVGGECEPLVPSAVSSSSSAASASAGAGGGGGGGAAACFDGCDVKVASPRLGEYPCAVEKILADNCRRCHSDAAPGSAPFSLDTYEASQALYAGEVLFSRIKTVVDSKFMPLSPPALTDEELTAISEWACACAPPRGPGESCK